MLFYIRQCHSTGFWQCLDFMVCLCFIRNIYRRKDRESDNIELLKVAILPSSGWKSCFQGFDYEKKILSLSGKAFFLLISFISGNAIWEEFQPCLLFSSLYKLHKKHLDAYKSRDQHLKNELCKVVIMPSQGEGYNCPSSIWSMQQKKCKSLFFQARSETSFLS